MVSGSCSRLGAPASGASGGIGFLCAVLALAVGCVGSNGGAPFAGEGDVLIPRLEPEWSARHALADTDPPTAAFSYLLHGEPLAAYRAADGAVFCELRPAVAGAASRPPTDEVAGLPAVLEEHRPEHGGTRLLVLDAGERVASYWGRGVSENVVRSVASEAGGDCRAEGKLAAAELVGVLPEGWQRAHRSAQFTVDLGEGRGGSHVSVRWGPPEQVAVFRLLLQDDEVAEHYSTAPSVQDPITTRGLRKVSVGNRDGWVGPLLNEGLRALVVPGEPGLVVLTHGNRLGNFVDDEGLVALAQSLEPGTRGELERWVDAVLAQELEEQSDAVRDIGELVAERDVDGFRRFVSVVDGQWCLQELSLRHREAQAFSCLDVQGSLSAGLLRPSLVDPRTRGYQKVWGIVNDEVDQVVVVIDGERHVADLTALRDGRSMFIVDASTGAQADVAAYRGDAVVARRTVDLGG